MVVNSLARRAHRGRARSFKRLFFLQFATSLVSSAKRAPHLPSLRASAALILAGMVAENQTEVSGLEHLERGYQNLEEQLIHLGAKIQRVDREGQPDAKP